MRRARGLVTALLGLVPLLSAGSASAQVPGAGVGADPFSFYYGYYLPHQQYMAAQPTPLDSINRMTANRQYAATTDRATLYDPISPYGEDEVDPLRPYGSTTGKGGGGNMARPGLRGTGGHGDPSNARGMGPAGYYNRTAQYFPTLREGRGANQNIATLRARRGGGMGMGGGMPSMGGGMGGGMGGFQ